MQIDVYAAPLSHRIWRERWIAAGECESILLTARLATKQSARIALHEQPDRSIVLVPETVPPDIDSAMLQAIADELLKTALIEAIRRNARVVSVVPFVEVTVQMALALSKFGFQRSSRVQKWQRTTATNHELSQFWKTVPPNFAFASYRFDGGIPAVFPFQTIGQPEPFANTPAIRNVSRNQIVSLLDGILKDSSDFSDIAPSSAEMMLRMWELIDSQIDIFLIWQNSELSGLAVFNRCSLLAVSYDSTESPKLCSTSINAEFVGVRPEHRRSGIGTWLLRSANLLYPSLTDVSVFVSEANAPVVAMYTGLGFVCSDSSALWVKNFAASPQD